MTGHIKIPAVPESLRTITDCVTAAASAAGFSARRIGDIELALEEASTNIFKYANPGNPGPIEITCVFADGRFSVEIRDTGKEFDMTRLPDPDLAADVTERPIGGLGAYLIKKIADEVTYRRHSGFNILTLFFNRDKN